MWKAFFETFFLCLMVGGLTSVLFFRRRVAVRLLAVLMISLGALTPEIIHGYFPRLHQGWIRCCVGGVIAAGVAWPFCVLIQKLERTGTPNA